MDAAEARDDAMWAQQRGLRVSQSVRLMVVALVTRVESVPTQRAMNWPSKSETVDVT